MRPQMWSTTEPPKLMFPGSIPGGGARKELICRQKWVKFTFTVLIADFSGMENVEIETI